MTSGVFEHVETEKTSSFLATYFSFYVCKDDKIKQLINSFSLHNLFLLNYNNVLLRFSEVFPALQVNKKISKHFLLLLTLTGIVFIGT